jgi:hypothetical protein
LTTFATLEISGIDQTPPAANFSGDSPPAVGALRFPDHFISGDCSAFTRLRVHAVERFLRRAHHAQSAYQVVTS